MGRMDGKVVFITGAARGQGRSHAIRLAEEGADIIAIDICEPIEGNAHTGATEADLAETVARVEQLDRRIIAKKVDVRNYVELKSVLDEAVAELGHLDVVVANAGINGTPKPATEFSDEEFTTVLDVNLTGVWRTAKAAIPHLMQAKSGSIVITSSSLAIRPAPNLVHYVAAKHGLTGLMKALALELAPHGIRVNTVNPTTVNTDMIQNPIMRALVAPDLPESERTDEVIAARFKTLNALPIPWVQPVDISNAVLYLASEEARYVTGTCMLVDGGSAIL